MIIASPAPLVPLGSIYLLVIIIYFVFVLGIGFYLKRSAKTGDGFLMAGRDMTAWIAGLAFVSASLGSLELTGWVAGVTSTAVFRPGKNLAANKAPCAA